MAGTVRMELLSGTIDGVNRVFSTSIDYKPNTVVGILNGQKLVSQITELGGKDVEFPVDNVPRDGDAVAAYFVSLA